MAVSENWVSFDFEISASRQLRVKPRVKPGVRPGVTPRVKPCLAHAPCTLHPAPCTSITMLPFFQSRNLFGVTLFENPNFAHSGHARLYFPNICLKTEEIMVNLSQDSGEGFSLRRSNGQALALRSVGIDEHAICFIKMNLL